MKNFDLSVDYMGLSLGSPIVVSSSGFSSSIQGVWECAAGGAGAVVLKSIFEEQMVAQASATAGYGDYPEAADYLMGYTQSSAIDQYLELIGTSAQECQIPIIASINCYNRGGSWVEFAGLIQQAGAAAIELNIFVAPGDSSVSGSELEQRYLDLAQRVVEAVGIPVSVKIPSGFTNVSNMAQELSFRGVRGVTMFNRFYSVDVDLEELKLKSAGILSTGGELSGVLRSVALSSAQVPTVDIAASGGILNYQGAVKALLCGARVAMVCSALYHGGISTLPGIVDGVESWGMDKGFGGVRDFVGLLSGCGVGSGEGADLYERAQFMKYFSAHRG